MNYRWPYLDPASAWLQEKCDEIPSRRGTRSTYGLAIVPHTEMIYRRKEQTGERPRAEATLEERITVLENAVRELPEAMNACRLATD
jgi:hypothetical protein